MSWLHAFILGLVQGATEFLPISSSAHLKLIKLWLHLPTGEETILFDLACHVGTLLALAVYFRKDLWHLFFLQPKEMGLYFLALLPLIPAYFLLKPILVWASQPHLLGGFLLVTALILFFAAWVSKRPSVASQTPHQNPSWKDALWIGTLQSIALVPGISRSASTITTGLWRGFSAKEAVRFSFLLSIPVVVGGTFLEILKLPEHSSLNFDAFTCILGLTVSALVGLASVRFAIPLLEKGIFKPFAWYCLIVSILLILWI